ncbi:SDR family oxidoreductase [Actinocorallia sp. API 0066]|uniref:SDR family NAD(P)-dependent oxidoreductase n=1 Tax=Actinocorallia sp. API 0066 TaxID=2896846 RepID=UPI001E519B75|nr:SDR family NAD(P)-dependent oxidoreductase [Actinocorallia sp. API 0066]MCD0453046.1 SDR family oxidoreductase [Actinocorallia sp. API 0066]
MLIEPTLRSDLLAGRVAVVTGGARGIGGATATTLAANGAHVVVAEVDKAKAAEAVQALNEEYGPDTASAYVADLVSPHACDGLVEFAVDTCGGLDIVVNNAGYAWDGRVHNMSDEQFQAMLDIHLIVPFRLARACAPVFREAARRDAEAGTVRHRKTVMVSSMAGLWGLDGAANYASAKAGVLGLMRTLAQEWGRYRVNVNAVAFGIIQTRFGLPQSDHEVIRTGGRTIHVGMPAKQAARLGVKADPTRVVPEAEMYEPKDFPGIRLGRTGTIREAADAIFWLCSPLSDYTTGQVIPVNGGAPGGMS